MKPEEICTIIKQKFFDIRKGYFHQKSYGEVSKVAVKVLHDHATLFDITAPMNEIDLAWIRNTAPDVIVKQLSYLNPPNFLLVDILSLRDSLNEQFAKGAEVNMNKIADATQWTFDSIAKTISTKAQREQKTKPSRKKK